MKKYLYMTAIAAALALPAGTVSAQSADQSNRVWEQQDRMQRGQNQATRMDAETIKSIQQALNEAGFDAGNVDGIFGQQTTASLRNFQRAQGLPATGQPDTDTLQSLGVDTDSTRNMRGQGTRGMQQQDQDMNQGWQ